MNNSERIKTENLLDYQTVDEADDLLQNGILVETSKGLVCMSLHDAIASDLNLSVEDLKNVATELISQQQNTTVSAKSIDKLFLAKTNLNFDSDGVSTDCSDTSAGSHLPTFITLKSLPNLELLNKSLVKSEIAASEPSSSASTKTTNLILTVVSDGGSTSQGTDKEETIVHKPPKRRGGWPKGRKRKPELKNLPPKAPATGYNLYLNEQRKTFKDSNLVFHEITKLIGNKWSNLSLEEKQPYLAKAEEDKRRYREELKQYRQSFAYRAYLAKKRRSKFQNNVFSESDMDATDEIDEEDNEELYCRVCDQYFHNLHNKREHLQGRQHTQMVAGEICRELDNTIKNEMTISITTNSFDESSLDLLQLPKSKQKSADKNNSVQECMVNLVVTVAKREREITLLQNRQQETSSRQNQLCQELSALTQKHDELKSHLCNLKEHYGDMENMVSQLWQVPSWFIINNVNKIDSLLDFNDGSE